MPQVRRQESQNMSASNDSKIARKKDVSKPVLQRRDDPKSKTTSFMKEMVNRRLRN